MIGNASNSGLACEKQQTLLPRLKSTLRSYSADSDCYLSYNAGSGIPGHQGQSQQRNHNQGKLAIILLTPSIVELRVGDMLGVIHHY